MGMVARILAMTCPSPTLEEIAERLITTEVAAFALSVADYAASSHSRSKSNRIRDDREALKQAIVEALEAVAKGKTG
jgi:hypothetical protein